MILLSKLRIHVDQRNYLLLSRVLRRISWYFSLIISILFFFLLHYFCSPVYIFILDLSTSFNINRVYFYTYYLPSFVFYLALFSIIWFGNILNYDNSVMVFKDFYFFAVNQLFIIYLTTLSDIDE